MEAYYSLTLPGDATFDVDGLCRDFCLDPAVFKHPYANEKVLIVCANEKSVDYLRTKLTEDPQAVYDTQGVITLHPEYITVSQLAPREILERLRRLILPIIREKECKIVSEFGDDITDRYMGKFEKLFSD